MTASAVSATKPFWKGLSPDRRPLVEALCAAIRRGLDHRYGEGLLWGQLAWFVPLSHYPPGYHAQPGTPLPLCSLGSTKGHVSLHLMGLGCREELRAWFEQAWRATGRRLDMGRGCVRIRSLAEVPLDLVEEVIRRQSVDQLIAGYESARQSARRPTGARASQSSTRSQSTTAPRRRPSPARGRAAVAADSPSGTRDEPRHSSSPGIPRDSPDTARRPKSSASRPSVTPAGGSPRGKTALPRRQGTAKTSLQSTGKVAPRSERGKATPGTARSRKSAAKPRQRPRTGD